MEGGGGCLHHGGKAKMGRGVFAFYRKKSVRKALSGEATLIAVGSMQLYLYII
jgi:hypothetical protein